MVDNRESADEQTDFRAYGQRDSIGIRRCAASPFRYATIGKQSHKGPAGLSGPWVTLSGKRQAPTSNSTSVRPTPSSTSIPSVKGRDDFDPALGI